MFLSKLITFGFIMYEPLRAYFSDKQDLSDEDFERIKAKFSVKRLRKRQYLLQEGDVCNFTAFVSKGALRQYLVDEKGNEHVTQFAIENWWISDRESLTLGTPTQYNVDALEDCELLIITKADFNELEREVPAFQRVMNQVKEINAIAGQNRVVRALSYTADEKYQRFVEKYPEIAQRVPQHMIASYLGITPETLSRIRRKLFGK